MRLIKFIYIAILLENINKKIIYIYIRKKKFFKIFCFVISIIIENCELLELVYKYLLLLEIGF